MINEPLDGLPLTSPGGLARLLDLEAAPSWRNEDAAAALRHQLSASLQEDLTQEMGMTDERLRAMVPLGMTFLSALHAPPNAEVLKAIKRWARGVRADASSPLSPGPATVLYYAAVVSARVLFGERITTLQDEKLAEGFAWAIKQEGAEGLRGLFERGLASL